jgi:16S rRNA G966 N2-methylase RsmD
MVNGDAGVLAQLSQARQLLEASRDLSEIKSIRDVALAAERYAKAKKLGEEAERYAAEIAARAERRYGQVLAITPPEKPGPKPKELSPEVEDNSTPRAKAGYKLSARSQKLASIPDDDFERMIRESKRLSADRLARIQRDREAEHRRVEQARKEAEQAGIQTVVDIRHGDFREVLADLKDVDAIITDPPYPAEFLPLLDDLAAWANKILTPDGVLAVLMGQTHLPEVYRRLNGGRPYRWTACYLTPGNGYSSMARRVQSNWKPMLVYGGGPRFADIIRSEGTDAAAKDNHHWGQDYGAFHTIVERFTQRGQTVVDPFMGSGTTLLAAHALGRHAIGCDIEAEHVAKAKERLS